MAKDTDKKEEVVKVAEKVTVFATSKAKHYNEGEEFEVHPELAKSLIKAGKATAEKVEPKKEK